MRTTILEGKQIESRWLSEKDAALYLDISVSTLRRYFFKFAHFITRRTIRYDQQELDEFLKHKRDQDLQTVQEVAERPDRAPDLSQMSITDPVTGRVYRPSPKAIANARRPRGC